MKLLAMTALALLAGVLLAAPPRAPLPPQAPPVTPSSWLSPLDFPPGMEKFEPTKWTQRIAVTSGRDTIDKVPVSGTPSKWHQSGGMEGIRGVRSDKFKLLPEPPREWIGNIWVWNGLRDSDGKHSSQQNRGLKREYVIGSRFDDILSYKGKAFEHRMRIKFPDDDKKEGKWHNAILWRDEAARPPGYTGMKMACTDCHNERNVFGDTGPGFGGYATGLAPGGDTVIGHPLPWHLVDNPEAAPQRQEEPFFQPFEPFQFQPSFNRSFRGGRRR